MSGPRSPSFLFVTVPTHEHLAQLSFRHPRPFEFPQPEVDVRQIEGFGVKGAANPFFHAFMLRVFPVLEKLEQVCVTPDAAAIFRRTGVGPVQAKCGRGRRGIGRQNLLDGDFVFPGIAEIVFVAELRVFVGGNLHQCGFHFIPIRLLAEAHVFGVAGIGIAGIAGEEVVQVTVGPSHRDLQDGVEPAEVGVTRHSQPPPDGWLGADQDDFQVIDWWTLP